MKIEQRQWISKKWEPALSSASLSAAQLVLAFGSTSLLKEKKWLEEAAKTYPKAVFFGCSTAGEICGTRVFDETVVLTAIHFEHTTVEVVNTKIQNADQSIEAGSDLGKKLKKENLAHVFVLSDGLSINGSDLVKGLTRELPKNIAITGGLSGDGSRFKETLVLSGDVAEKGMVAALGFYGKRLKISYASVGGWDSFGPERLITKSTGNILYELDGKSALELYKKYLGEHAKGLPATGFLFPLSLRTKEGEAGVVRTILSVNEKEQSLTFAGNMPEGAMARLMKANFDRLIDGATAAAKSSHTGGDSSSPELAILISCVGRKLILKQRVEEEVEGVRNILGDKTILTGFYSYGEISPFTPGAKCELHNQTMTITNFSEI